MKAALLVAALALPGHPVGVNHAQHAALAYIATPRNGSGPAEGLRVYRCKPHRRMTQCRASWSDHGTVLLDGVPTETEFHWIVYVQRRGHHPLCMLEGNTGWDLCYGR